MEKMEKFQFLDAINKMIGTLHEMKSHGFRLNFKWSTMDSIDVLLDNLEDERLDMYNSLNGKEVDDDKEE